MAAGHSRAWRTHLKGPALQPWDYWYAAAGAGRELSHAIPRDAVLPLSERFYRDLGADLPSSACFTISTCARARRRWRIPTTCASVDASAGAGARRYRASRRTTNKVGCSCSTNWFTRTATRCTRRRCVRARRFILWAMTCSSRLLPTSLRGACLEPALAAQIPRQQRYHERHRCGSSIRTSCSTSRGACSSCAMLHDPSADPNAVWTEITSRYLNVVPHPELSWWALRVQLVRWPGYMINYGLGAVLTADIRQRIAEGDRPFRHRQSSMVRVDLAAFAAVRRIARHGGLTASIPGSTGLHRIPAQPAAAPRRSAGWCSLASASSSAAFEQPDRLVHVRFVDHQRRHEAHRALAAGQQHQTVVIGARDQRIAQFLAPAPCWPDR